MAVAIPYVIAAIAAYGAVTQAQAAKDQARAAQNTANYNSALAERNARIAREQAAAAAERQNRLARIRMGDMEAAYGASGITSEGSPLDILQQSSFEAELDRKNILYKGELRAMGHTEEIALEQYGAAVTTQQAGQRARAGYVSAAGQIMGAYSGSGGGGVKNYYQD